MTINNSFIPCAGKGTRMGPLGLKLAKPLWRVFDKSLLEIQIEVLKKMNCKKFILNTHHLNEQMESYTDNLCNTKVLYEKTLLGSGGCFHNLKKEESSLEKLISLNSDVQIILSDRDSERLQKDFNENDFVLVCLPVKKGDSYNEVCYDEKGYFLEVKPPNDSRDYVTYSGFGMVNISKLNYVEGESSFFKTVINNKINKTKIFIPSDSYEYWDWGTKELYLVNIASLLNPDNESVLKNFLIKNNVINEAELGINSYRSCHEGVVNFTGNSDLGMIKKGIYMEVNEKIEFLSF